jgi:hypothetical protein
MALFAVSSRTIFSGILSEVAIMPGWHRDLCIVALLVA